MTRSTISLTILIRLFLAVVLIFSSSTRVASSPVPGKGEAGSREQHEVLPQDGQFEGAYLKTEPGQSRGFSPKLLLLAVPLEDVNAVARPRVLAAQSTGISHVSPLIITQTSASEY